MDNETNPAAVTPETPPANDPTAAAKMVEARVLQTGYGYPVNAVISGKEAKAAIKAGWADGDPDAVTYAKSLAD